MKKKWFVALAVVGVAMLAFGILSSLPVRADGGDTQGFSPARFALVEGEINVSMLQQGGDNTQKVMMKIDTVTGQVWVLQLTVAASNDPQVNRAVWTPVANSGSYQPGGPQQNAPAGGNGGNNLNSF